MKNALKKSIPAIIISTLLVVGIVVAAFPTSLSGFSSGNTITSSWANALEAKIGADSSATSTSIDYLIKHASSKLGSIANIATTDSIFIVGDGSKFVGESGATVRTSLDLGSMALEANTGSTTITTLGTIATGVWSGTSILNAKIASSTDYLADTKWTGVSTDLVAATGRTSLGLDIGTNVQAYDAGLLSIAGLITGADMMIYTTASDTYATTTLSSFARTILDDTTAGAVRTTIGAGTGSGDLLSTNNLSELTATSTARTNLGLAIGTNVQAYDADLTTLSTPTASSTVAYQAGAYTFVSNSTSALAQSTAQGALTFLASIPDAIQDTITRLGTIVSGVWTGTVIGSQYGGTGQNLSSATGFLKFAAGVATTTATVDISTDTNLAAGRSLTMSGDSVEADAELFTDSKCLWFESPTAVDDFQSIWRSSQAITFTKVWAESDQTVTFNLVEDATGTSSILSANLAPAAGTASTTSFADASFAAGSRLDLVAVSVSGTPTWVSICWDYTKDD